MQPGLLTVLCRFLDEYDLKVSNGPFKYKKAAEFLMNTTIIGIKGIVKSILAAKESAAQRAAAAEATVAQVRAVGQLCSACRSKLGMGATAEQCWLMV